MADIYFEDQPPKPGPDYPILRVKAETQTRFLFVGSQLRGMWTHYTKQGSMPCINPRTECPYCTSTKNRRWKGYIHAINMRNHEEGFLEITPGGAKAIKEQHGGLCGLRGLQAIGSRGKGETARQKIEIVYALPSSKTFSIPPERDPMETLREIWGHCGFKLLVGSEIDVDVLQQTA